MLFEVEPLLDVGAEQVPDLLVVDLEVGGVHEVLHVLARVDGLEDVLERARDDAALSRGVRDPLHREGLAAARLAVGEHGAIVALQHALRTHRCVKVQLCSFSC